MKQEFYCKACNKCMYFCCHKCATPIQIQDSEPFCTKCTKRRYYACRKCGYVPGRKDRQVCAHKGCNAQEIWASCQQCETSYCISHDTSCKRGWNGACFLQKIRQCAAGNCVRVCVKCWNQELNYNSDWNEGSTPVYCNKHWPPKTDCAS